MSSPDNYQLGKGIVFFDQVISGVYQGERDLGNAPAFTFNVSIEKLEHYSSRGGLKAKDKEVISQMTPSLSFTLDEVDKENLALLTLGDVTEISQTGSTVTDEVHVAHLGRRFQVAFRDISAVTITNSSDADTPLVSGQDFEIDSDMKDDSIGRVHILADAPNVSEGDNLDVDYTYGTVAYTVIKAFANTQIEGKLRFVSDNPAGQQEEVEVWRVSLTPSGDTALIGDDWSTLGFSGEILKDETQPAENSPYMNITM